MATRKQKAAAANLSENVGRPIGEVMREVGYSEVTSLTPQRLTESKGWQELMSENLPDSLLFEKHRELLTVPKKVRRYLKGDVTDEYEELDSGAVSKGLDMAYKLKGAYAAEKHLNVNTTVEIENVDSLKQLAHGLLSSQRQ